MKQLLLLYPFWGELFYVEHQSLKVFTFRMVDVDRMVGRLGELVQDADIATGNGSRREYSHAELFPIDRL